MISGSNIHRSRCCQRSFLTPFYSLLLDTLSCSKPPHLHFSAKGFLGLVVPLCQAQDTRGAPRNYHSTSQKQPSIGDSWELVYKHPSSLAPWTRSLHCAALCCIMLHVLTAGFQVSPLGWSWIDNTLLVCLPFLISFPDFTAAVSYTSQINYLQSISGYASGWTQERSAL